MTVVTGREHDLGALEAVAGEPELSPEHAEASTERQTGDTDARARTPRHGDVVRSEGGVQVDQPCPRSDRVPARWPVSTLTWFMGETSMTRPGPVDQPP